MTLDGEPNEIKKILLSYFQEQDKDKLNQIKDYDKKN